MMNKIANKLALKMANHSIISEENIDIYVYGIELLISFVFSTSIILIIGGVGKMFLPTLAFLAVFIILRSFSGGFHAKTYFMCTVVTLTTYAVVMIAAKTITVPEIGFYVLAAIGIVVLGVFAPIPHPNKELSQTKKKRSKIVSVILLVAFIAVGVVLYQKNETISRSIFFSIIADLLLLFIKNKARKEKTE